MAAPKKNKGGRPRRAGGLADVRIAIRITEAEQAAYQAAADAWWNATQERPLPESGAPIAEWMRDLANRVVKKLG
jgi:hypothetical protein